MSASSVKWGHGKMLKKSSVDFTCLSLLILVGRETHGEKKRNNVVVYCRRRQGRPSIRLLSTVICTHMTTYSTRWLKYTLKCLVSDNVTTSPPMLKIKNTRS